MDKWTYRIDVTLPYNLSSASVSQPKNSLTPGKNRQTVQKPRHIGGIHYLQGLTKSAVSIVFPAGTISQISTMLGSRLQFSLRYHLLFPGLALTVSVSGAFPDFYTNLPLFSYATISTALCCWRREMTDRFSSPFLSQEISIIQPLKLFVLNPGFPQLRIWF